MVVSHSVVTAEGIALHSRSSQNPNPSRLAIQSTAISHNTHYNLVLLEVQGLINEMCVMSIACMYLCVCTYVCACSAHKKASFVASPKKGKVEALPVFINKNSKTSRFYD